MRTTLITLYSTFVLCFYECFTSASVVNPNLLFQRQATTVLCTIDEYFDGLFYNSLIADDVTSLCSSLENLQDSTSCIDYVTPKTTIYPTTIITGTVTSTVTSYGSTVTATTTETQLGLRHKRHADAAAMAAVTDAVSMALWDRSHPKQLGPRQGGSSNMNSFVLDPSKVSSACVCNTNITAKTDLDTCTASTSTVIDDVIGYVDATVTDTVSGGITTVTQTVNVTSSIVSVISTATNGSASTWTVSYSSTTSFSGNSGMSSTSESSSPSVGPSTSTSSSWSGSTTESSTMTHTWSGNRSGNWSGKWSSTTTSAISTITPSGCPGINGTTFVSGFDSCQSYQRICGQSYAPSDFYDEEYYFPSPEACTSVCDAANSGGATPCVGIVWNNTATNGSPNCRQLQSTDTPIPDPAAIALLLVPNPACQSSTTTSSSITTASNSSASTTMSSSIGPYSNSTSMTTTFNITTSPTTAWPGWSGTEARNFTWTGFNHTRSFTWTGPYNSSTPVTSLTTTFNSSTTSSSVGPISTNNSSCPVLVSTIYASNATTITSVLTVFATNTTTLTVTQLDSTTLASTETDTVTSSVVSVNTILAPTTVTVDVTVTVSATGERRVNKGQWDFW